MTIPTLDQRAAQYAQQVVKKGANLGSLDVFITETLGVLQEQGVCACLLFLYSRTDKKKKPMARVVREQLWAMLEMLGTDYRVNWRDGQGNAREIPGDASNDNTARDVLEFYADVVATDLDTLLLVRDLYEQTLIYARYGAKAEGK